MRCAIRQRATQHWLHISKCCYNKLACRRWQTPSCQHSPVLVDDLDVVMGLGPIIANKDHLLLLLLILRSGTGADEPEGHPRELMDQCSRHDTPSVLWRTLTNQPGHVLSAEIESPTGQVLTGRRLGHHTATAKRSPRDVPPLDRAQRR